jgi:hypothetical protein
MLRETHGDKDQVIQLLLSMQNYEAERELNPNVQLEAHTGLHNNNMNNYDEYGALEGLVEGHGMTSQE